MNQKIKKTLIYSSLSLSSIVAISLSISIPLSNKKSSPNFLKWKGVEEISNSIEEIRDEYSRKYEESLIKVQNHKANVEVSNDSYEQSKKISFTEPNANLNFTYERAGQVDEKTFLTSNKSNFRKLLDDSIYNKFNYSLSNWKAKAGKRYIGNAVVVPMYASEVTIEHEAKIYDTVNYINMKKITFFLYDLYNTKIRNGIPLIIKKLLPNLSDSDRKWVFEIVDWIFEGVVSNLTLPSRDSISKLKPCNVSEINSLQYTNFGNFKVKYSIEKTLSFKSNNVIPIVDYESKYVCGGPLCSHNLRSLVDVIVTATETIAIANFGTISFSSFFEQTIIRVFLDSFIDKGLGRLFGAIMYASNRSGLWVNDITKYIVKNSKEILLNFFGKVEKHGLQLGKCGNLVSGIKIKSDDNIVRITNDEPLLIFAGAAKKIFNEDFTKYNFNSIHCIRELSNYKKLYYFLKKNISNDNIFSIFESNIFNLSVPSKEIYAMYLDYINNDNKPSIFTEKLDSFKLFAEEGWKVPKNIDTWSFLNDFIVPNILNKNYFVRNENNEKIYLYKENNFVTFDKNVRGKENQIINLNEMDIFSDSEEKEILRNYHYEEII